MRPRVNTGQELRQAVGDYRSGRPQQIDGR